MKKIIILGLLLIPFWGFTQVSYEYISISQSHRELKITYGAEEFEVVNLAKEGKYLKRFDFRPILKKVESLETKGWVVYSSNQYNVGRQIYPMLHFLLRKKK